MKIIKIYGSSDDLIEVEGDIEAEFSVQEEDGFLAINDGTLIHYEFDGIWHFRIISPGSAIISNEVCYEGESERYSDIVTMAGDLKWVAHCNDYSIK